MLKLHFAPNSRAERILWLLEELELPYELNEMAFHPSDLKSDEHRARFLGRIPVLDDGDIQIWESGAITEYIIEKYKNGGLKPDVQSELNSKYLQWFHHWEKSSLFLYLQIMHRRKLWQLLNYSFLECCKQLFFSFSVS